MDSPLPGAPSSRLLIAVRHLLRPLVRLLLGNGVTYPALLELLKEAYVKEAETLSIDGKPPTDSRISLLTGVHRKDVRRLRDEPTAKLAYESLTAQLFARWISTPDYLDEAGNPLPLARLASHGGGQSFEALVQSVSKDIRPRVVLDEWLRLQRVAVDAEDRVHLKVKEFLPNASQDDKVFFAGQNLHDHIAAVAHNVSGALPPFLERCVFYDGLTTTEVAALKTLAESEGMSVLQLLSRQAMAMKADRTQPPAAPMRINCGIYFYCEPEQEVTDEPSN
ncbi:hypothetical protein HNQ59_002957 [Chitinivorax tropicus]|uniref:Uncharacterized protein n=1 Tax=Chitinivorax tropicus TaxID=714531 RepID=A0A840MRD5_9PROT|nr:DUF6502 family protein [Chitinivorax tropicus]MBB5019649.1 hypothetical protein [Chitinivorax tropicus]